MSVWNKQRREEEPSGPLNTNTIRPAPPAPPVEAKKEATTLSSMSNMPAGRMEPESSRGGSATIGKAVKIAGQIYSREDLYVDGDVEGTIELMDHKLTIGPNGKVHAGVKAREVVALGVIQGNVEASERIEIRKDAKLVGDIKTARIIIEDGAYFKGSIDIVKSEPKGGSQPAALRSPRQLRAGARGGRGGRGGSQALASRRRCGVLSERLKSFLRGPRSSAEAGPPANGGAARFVSKPGREEARMQESRRAKAGASISSSALSAIRPGCRFWIWAALTRRTSILITSLGHKFYSEDFLRIFQETFGEDIADQSNPGRIDYFLRRSLDYPDDQFDGVLAWDALEYMEPALLVATADRLLRILSPRGICWRSFIPPSASRSCLVTAFVFRICARCRSAGRASAPRSQQLFNNRSLEKLFQKFESVKFFLARDNLREVIVRK